MDKTDPPISCPVCAVAMLPEQKHTLLLDRCPRCRGLWFDHPELQAYVQKEGLTVRQSLPGLRRLPDVGCLACPRCLEPSLEAWRSGATFVSKCRHCSGVFLDLADVRALAGRRSVYQIPGPIGSAPSLPEWADIPFDIGLEIVLEALGSWL